MEEGSTDAQRTTVGADAGADRGVAVWGREEGDLKSELVRLAVEKIVEEALEAKVRDLVGRDYYARRDEGAHGYRNGYRRGRLKTSEGEVEYAVPRS